VRIVPLPRYSPELNPCEQAWDVIKDEVSNHCHQSIDKLRDALRPSLKRFWEGRSRRSPPGWPPLAAGPRKRFESGINSHQIVKMV
jgi:transposase